MATIQLKRGVIANLPASAAAGEPVYTTDDQQLHFGTGAAVVPLKIAGANVTGTVGAAQLPLPTASTLGGIKSLAAVATKFVTSVGTDGIPVAAQPAFTDISGAITAGQLPATIDGGTF